MHHFPQVDEGKTESEEDDKLGLRWRQADICCCIFQHEDFFPELGILDIKLNAIIEKNVLLILKIGKFQNLERFIAPQL